MRKKIAIAVGLVVLLAALPSWYFLTPREEPASHGSPEQPTQGIQPRAATTTSNGIIRGMSVHNGLVQSVNAGPCQSGDMVQTGITPGTFGNSSFIPSLTVDGAGRLTAITNIPQVIVDQGGQVFNVMAPKYGAKGDGQLTTDDSVAINAAIADALAVSGEVFFPPPPGGFYNINNPLTITGSGMQTVSIRGPPNTTNHGITINYNGPANTSVVTMLGIQGCQFTNFGIQIASGLNNVVVWDTQFSASSLSTNSYTRWNGCNVRFQNNLNPIGWRLGYSTSGSSAYNIVWRDCAALDYSTNSGSIGWQIGGSQAYSSQFYSCNFTTSCGVLAGAIASYASSPLNINDTAINVGDTLLFPASGTVSIGGIQFPYTSKSVAFGPGRLNLASPSGNAFSANVQVSQYVTNQGVYPGNCSFSFCGGGSSGTSMGYDFVIECPGYALIFGGQYQQTTNQRRFLQTGQAGSALGVHVTVQQCALKGYQPPLSVDNNGVIWVGNFATTIRLIDVTANGQSTGAYSNSGYFLTTVNGQLNGSILLQHCEIFGTAPFINNTNKVPLSTPGSYLTDVNNHVVGPINNTYALPIVLTDAATVNLDLSQGDSFYLLTTAAIGATRNVTVSNAPLGTKTFRLFIQQPASGGPCDVGTWFTGNTVNWLEGVTPNQSNTANAIDQYEFSQPISGTYVAKQILSSTANLPANIALTNVINNFTANQQFSGLVGMGVSPQAGNGLYVQPTSQTLTSGTYNAISANMVNTPASNSTATITGFAPTATWNGTAGGNTGLTQAISGLASTNIGSGGSTGTIRGNKNQALNNGLGSVNMLEGINNVITNQGGGSASVGRGTYNQVQVSNSSTISTGYGGYFDSPSIASSGTIGSSYGIRILNQGGTGVTNSTGIRIDAQSGSSNTNKALDIAGGDVILSGGALPTNATNGFMNIPTCAGQPTGTPASFTGTVPMVFDTSNFKIWIYVGGAWKGVVVN